MSFMQKGYRYVISLREAYLQKLKYKAEMRNIERKKHLYEKVCLSTEQEQEIISYWKEISGEIIPTNWHRLYQSYCGVYDKKYFPEILYSTKLEKLLSPPKYYGILSDKGLIVNLFPDSHLHRNPRRLIWNSDGNYIDADNNMLSLEDVQSKLFNAGKCVIKPTMDTSSGEGVRVLDLVNGKDIKTGETVLAILAQYQTNYIIQEKIAQHAKIDALYAGALNTFRIITYICNDQVHVAPLSMRLGTGTAEVDNIHAGGGVIGVDHDYHLRKYAFTEMGERFDKHPTTGAVFEGYDICVMFALTLWVDNAMVSFFQWGITAVAVSLICGIVVLLINCVFYREFLFAIFKRTTKRMSNNK